MKNLLFVWVVERITLPETNIAPENGWLEDVFPIGKAYFQGLLLLVSGRVYFVMPKTLASLKNVMSSWWCLLLGEASEIPLPFAMVSIMMEGRPNGFK